MAGVYTIYLMRKTNQAKKSDEMEQSLYFRLEGVNRIGVYSDI